MYNFFQHNKKLAILIVIAALLLVVIGAAQVYRLYVGARLPIPGLSDTMIGGRLTPNVLSVGNHTLEFRAKTRDGKILNDTATFNVASVLQSAVAHISYEGHNTGLMYATNGSGSWVTTEVDRSIGSYSDLAIDSKGKIHISYMAYLNQNQSDFQKAVKYATNVSGSWVTTVVAPVDSGVVNLQTSIALDSNGKAHISYNDLVPTSTGKAFNLKYATNVSGNWVTSTVDASEGAGRYSSITIDKDNKAHVSYIIFPANSSESLKYATNETGSWVSTVVDTQFASGYGSSIKIDGQNNPHISYISSIDKDVRHIKYATRDSGDWVTETVDSSGLAAGPNSLVLDAQDKAHIAYKIFSSEVYGDTDLHYATNVSGAWVREPIDTGAWAGESPAIAIDSGGKLHITYGDSFNRANRLKYATNATGNWTTSVVDPNATISIWYTSIGLTPLNTPSPDPVAAQFWQNSDNKFDVNDDGSVTSADGLALINLQNTGSFAPYKTTTPQSPFYDVNGDTEFTAVDILRFSQCLNQGMCN